MEHIDRTYHCSEEKQVNSTTKTRQKHIQHTPGFLAELVRNAGCNRFIRLFFKNKTGFKRIDKYEKPIKTPLLKQLCV